MCGAGRGAQRVPIASAMTGRRTPLSLRIADCDHGGELVNKRMGLPVNLDFYLIFITSISCLCYISVLGRNVISSLSSQMHMCTGLYITSCASSDSGDLMFEST